MADVHSKAQRSFNMSRIRGADTKPELAVRRLVSAMGYRYRLRSPDLLGKPDLVFRAKKKVIFVHGCFWHRHSCKLGKATPATRSAFWQSKFAANKRRDARVGRSLRRDGWAVLIVWECELKKTDRLKVKLSKFLSAESPNRQDRR